MARIQKQNSLTDTIVRGAAFIIIGIVLIIFMAKDLFNSFKEPAYLYDQKTADITEGAYLQEDIFAALDYFMYEETSRTKFGIELSSSTTSYYYIVPVLTEDAGDLYMAVEVPAEDEAALSSVCDSTYLYLMGELSDEEFGTNTYHVTGNIRNMKQEELDYMVEWFSQTEYFGTTDTNEIMNYIHPVMLEKYNGTTARIMTVLGLVFILIGAIILKVAANARRKQKETDAAVAASLANAAYDNSSAVAENVSSQEANLYNSTYDNL